MTAIADDLSSFELLGALTVVIEPDAEVDINLAELRVGAWVEVEGEFENGVLEAEELELADEQETEIEAVLQNLTDSSFNMLGLTITHDDNTEVECGDDEDEEDDDDDDDDDECEQEGEHEGENEGC